MTELERALSANKRLRRELKRMIAQVRRDKAFKKNLRYCPC